MKKILCFVWVYYDFDIISKCLNTLFKQDELDIIIVENYSEFTDTKIKPTMMQYLQEDKIKKYYLFDKNITNNAWEIAVQDSIMMLHEYETVMLTDGDLSTNDDLWLQEEKDILKNQSVFAVGIQLDLTNMPKGVNWIPRVIKHHDTFDEVFTGTHFTLMRTADLLLAKKYSDINGLPFRDTSLHKYMFSSTKKIWARTLQSVAYHHTWDYLKDPNNKYMKEKTANFSKTWDHYNYCDYTVYTKNLEVRKSSEPKRARKIKNSQEAIINKHTQIPDAYKIKRQHINKPIVPRTKTFSNGMHPNIKNIGSKIHIGCGHNYMDGWINVDVDAPKVDLKHNLLKKLPLPDNHFSYIFHEHVLEHFTKIEGEFVLQECLRLLKPGGVLRIAVPDLEEIIAQYSKENWKNQWWIQHYGYSHIETKCEITNLSFTEWGHKFLYDEEFLIKQLYKVGFSSVARVLPFKSEYKDLVHIETREDSLVVEAVK
jgi:predicted SAM-dependent methyltransferase